MALVHTKHAQILGIFFLTYSARNAKPIKRDIFSDFLPSQKNKQEKGGGVIFCKRGYQINQYGICSYTNKQYLRILPFI